jgi:hypothetical protein
LEVLYGGKMSVALVRLSTFPQVQGQPSAKLVTVNGVPVAPSPVVRAARLPRSSLRRRPKPARQVGFDAYRLVVAGNGNFHVMGPGFRDEQLSAFAEERRKSGDNIAVALRDVRNLLNVVNKTAAALPNARALLVRDVRSARRVYRAYVKARKWTTQNGRNSREGIFIVTGDDARSYENAVTVLALSRFFQFLTDRDEFPDIDPMRMDPSRSRLGAGETRSTFTQDGKVTVDTDLMFRTPQAQRIAPRTGDPFFLQRILAAGDAAGWPLVVRTLVQSKGLTGGRDFQLRPIPVFNWLVLGKGDFIHAPGKFSKGKLEVRLRVCKELHASLVRLMDSTYPHLGGFAGLMKKARSRNDRDELKGLYIFSLNGRAPVSYSFVNDDWFRPVIERAGLCVEDLGDGTSEPVRRWVTMHWLRHEFTNTILQRIEESGVSQKDKMVQRILLARYMGWKSAQAMLEFYGRWFFNKEVDEFIAAQMEAANDNSLPAAFDEDFDADHATDEERDTINRIMGGLLKVRA